MDKTIYLKQDELRRERTVTHPSGVNFRVGLSGYDIPRTVNFKYTKKGFLTTFSYIDDEKPKKINYDGNAIFIGKYSGKIIGILLSFGSGYYRAQRMIKDRLNNATRDNQKMNAILIQDVIRQYFP